MNFNLSSHATLTGVFFVALVPNLNAALASIDLTPNVAASATPFHSSNFGNTTSDTFAYDPGNPTAVLPTTVWSSATHFHQGNQDPVFWEIAEITWTDGSDLQFDFYGRTGCCPDRDNNYDIHLLSGGTAGSIVHSITGNNAPDAGTPANYLRTDLGAGLANGVKFDTIRINGNNDNFTIAEVRLAGDIVSVPEPSALALLGLAGAGLLRRRR